MRWHAVLSSMVLVAGCKPTFKGWWDLDSWTVTRDGEDKPLVKTDAGVVVWQQSSTNAGWGNVYVVLRYDYDPVGFALVPDPDPEQHEQPWSFDEWEKGMPVELEWPESEDLWLTATFEILDFDPNAMTLEGPSPMEDGAVWSWSLVR